MSDDLRTRARGVAIRSAALFEAAWDEGNAMGLDGWTGPGRGTEPDQHAIDRRERTVDRLVDDLYSRVAGYLAHAAQQPTREDIRDELAHWPIGHGYESASVSIDDAGDMADAVLALFDGAGS